MSETKIGSTRCSRAAAIRRVALASLTLMLLSAGSCPPPCPPGEKCGQSPKPVPEDTCAYKLTCFYSQAANQVQISGLVFNAKEPFPAIKTQIKASPDKCFSFSGNIQPSVTITSVGGEFSFGVPLNAGQAASLYPGAGILADPNGTCAPSAVSVSARVENEPSVCACSVKWP
jgi:hypothetical protein